MKILVVDDSANDRKHVAKLFTEAFPGCSIEAALGPREALKKCAQTKFDMISVDGDLGCQNDYGRGDDLVRELNGLYPELQIVIITNDLGMNSPHVCARFDKLDSLWTYRAEAIKRLRSLI